MRKINIQKIAEESWVSPKGKFSGAGRGISEALGRIATSMDLAERHPFDVEITRIPAGKVPYPYHSHSAQWEFYLVLEGEGAIRHEGGQDEIKKGDAFIFGPDAAHQLINDSAGDLVVLVVADNPIGESCYYPDSKKWLVRSPQRNLIRSDALDYYDGEE